MDRRQAELQKEAALASPQPTWDLFNSFLTTGERKNNATSLSNSSEQPASDNSTGATTPIDVIQPNDNNRSLTATNSSLPSTSGRSISLKTAKEVETKILSTTKKEEEEEVLTFSILKQFVISLAERFNETLATVINNLLEFFAKMAAAASLRLVEMLEILKLTEEEKVKKEKEEQLASWLEQIRLWWAPPPPKEPKGWFEKLAIWWSSPTAQQQQQSEPQDWLERLMALWATPAVKKEEPSSSFFSAVVDCFPSFS